jgi:DNA mismatch repair protein MSH5
MDEIVMAIDMLGRSTIGCAYYVSRDETLYFMEDSKLADASLIDSCQIRGPKNDGERLTLG